MLENPESLMPLNVSYGTEALGELTKCLNDGDHGSVLLVTGRRSFDDCGIQDLLIPVLEGRRVLRVSNFDTNPQKKDVFKVLKESSEFEYTAILAIGGGSVMDMAKLIKCFKDTPEQIDAVLHEAHPPEPSSIDLWAIPTTAGSGSEATHFAVVYDEGIKFSVAHRNLLPQKSWILSSVLTTVPNDVAAASAMDALSQGIESYWSIHSTSESKNIAERAVKLAWNYMIPAVLDEDPFALMQMGKAAHLAGMAINLTKTTAPHAISYALTSHFDLLHGHAVAVMLPEILDFNFGVSDHDVRDTRGARYVKNNMLELAAMLNESVVSEAAAAIRLRIYDLGLPVDLYAMGVTSTDDRELIVRDGFHPDRVNNNPRKLTEFDLRTILQGMK